MTKSYNDSTDFMSDIKNTMDNMQNFGTDLVEVVTRPSKENMIGGCCHVKHAGRYDLLGWDLPGNYPALPGNSPNYQDLGWIERNLTKLF